MQDLHLEAVQDRKFSTAKPRGPRKPLRQLDARGQALVRLMTFGPEGAEAAEAGVEPFKPVSLEKAARIVGLRLTNARFIFSQKIFLTEYSNALAAIRNGMKARAVSVLADMMDDPGNGLAADRAVRTKAATVLLGDEQGKGGVAVNINAGPQLTAGIVICYSQPAHAEKAEAYKRELELKANPPEPSRFPMRRGEDLQERALPPIVDQSDDDDTPPRAA